MGMKTRKVKRSKPMSKINPATGNWETTYEDYWADESYWEADTSSSVSGDSGGSYGGDN
jgi:hypothetical protein